MEASLSYSVATVTILSETKHYCPKSILCVVGILIYKLVYRPVLSYLNENNIMCKFQSGYRPCTQSALVKIRDDIREATDSFNVTGF